TEPRYLVGWPSARSELVVPLRIDDEVVGVFDIQSRRHGAFSEADVRVLSDFADRAALAIRLAELVGQLEARTRVLEAVGRAAQLLNFRLQTPDVLSSFVEETSRAFPNADGCIAYVVKEDLASFSIAAAYGLGKVTQTAVGSDVIMIDEFRCAGRAFRENRPVFVEIQGLDELMSGLPSVRRARVRSSVDNAEIRHLLAVPIRVGERGLGVIEILALRPRAFTASDAETLLVLAEHAAIALRNARLFEELQRSNRLKDDFLANLSHEVRTPLTGIVGWSEVLLDARGEDPETRRALEAILGQADTLSRMLADLIDLSRIDNFGLEIRRTRVKLPETIAAALDAVSPSAAKKGVELTCDIAPDVPAIEGDPGRLKQVVWNLLTNGIKFSPSGSAIDIRLTTSLGGGAELTVSDQGSGIDPSFLPHVFDRFRQEETSSNRRFGGLGVGLAIAQAIVGAHGGTIGVESEGRGRGCRFHVTFPATRRPISSSGSTPRLVPRPAESSPLPVVLVLESDPSNRDHLVRLCESLGFQTTAAADEAEAHEMGERIRPGVLLIPANASSGPDGLMESMQRKRGGERLRFIAVTDSKSDSEHRRLAGAGFSQVIVRPARRTMLERALSDTSDLP
ncbi:MAG: ATP-binding protein, partial [Thermoanaerobaculia bacterium]